MARVNNSYYAILGILSIEPMSGYQIKNSINGGAGYFLEIDYKQIYPTLKNIVADGLATYEVVKTEKGGESKRYMLTDAGFHELEKWLKKPVTNGKQRASELMLKLFYGHNTSVDVILAHMENYRLSVATFLQELEDLSAYVDSKSEKNPFWYYRRTTVNRGLMHRQTELDWCEQTIAYIQEHIKPSALLVKD
ncbi:PadR family transcriptional regulator [Kineothrix alysoides]|uniref:PadR family transcriptional regulator n=1 Tax=Kineothrix alysoides TaxID=1469948 RepID=UPI00068CB0B3|nr:PadR family transcriptional regulator [Kineothrix alysoides]